MLRLLRTGIPLVSDRHIAKRKQGTGELVHPPHIHRAGDKDDGERVDVICCRVTAFDDSEVRS